MRHGSQLDPPNRFERMHVEADLEQVACDPDYVEGRLDRDVLYLPDNSQSIVAENDSPDVGFRYSVNPYRGCAHGCSYCYARNSHEYLGFNAGLDFETRIMVKHAAPDLFCRFLARPAWQPEVVVFSGVTDCYQPAERRFCLTRRCLQVASECAQPVSIITKNALVLRDLDLIADMAERRLVQVNVSVTTLDPLLARDMEPRTSTPAARLRAVCELSAAGVPVRVMAAPVIPGLNDIEMPAILTAARDAGARSAAYVLLRLPLTVEPVFREWLHRARPDLEGKVSSAIRQTRRGRMNQPRWKERMTGCGPIAEQIGSLFDVFARKLGLDSPLPSLDFSRFKPPEIPDGQLRLF